MQSRLLRVALALATALVSLPLDPAGAHCPPGTEGAIAGAVSTCGLNDEAETAVDALNAASEGRIAFVLLKDFRFHPDVVTIKAGGTVVFLHADVDWQRSHDPQSSGPCGAPVDPAITPEACPPTNPGRCFDGNQDLGGAMGSPGDTYALTFRYAAATGTVEKSHGLLTGTPIVGEPPFAQPFRACPSGSAYPSPARAVLSFHCGIHGASGAVKEMRGAIVIEA